MVVLAEYIWIDAYGGLRSKTRVFHNKDTIKLKDLPNWNYDGSSTGQAPGEDSEVMIVPRVIYPDPFRKNGNHVLVLTDTYTPQGEPIPTNTRAAAAAIFEAGKKEIPWFGIEQEYTMFKDGTPLGWPHSKARAFGGPTKTLGYPGPQGPYYCGAGADVAFGRDIVEEHLAMCLYAGLNVSGINAEVMPGQWEFQVGPCVGIDGADQLWVARYILNRLAEKYGIIASLDPKPIPGDWNGAGCHTNFSTKKMREGKNALDKVIIPAIERLGNKHAEHIAIYGTDNELRLTGGHETASIDTFKWGFADRGASVRIGNETREKGRGYLEDRRPASNMDPYLVTAKLFHTAVLDAPRRQSFLGIHLTKGPRKSIVGLGSKLKRASLGR
ncbi:Glutamine synthetase [Hondaea fermentalgiana]|uniref:Glutamine synthetase n=1 Tax=Hondaea fermentalgiana TaxID=2315210 RepID=A0A2R5GVI7_9STRA|nr:Glutamine synthetase [Hondaea fermentalgiana]|eukprot:GBG34860.1 Glutamine synthetase [Hondaea fermentalgiana]